ASRRASANAVATPITSPTDEYNQLGQSITTVPVLSSSSSGGSRGTTTGPTRLSRTVERSWDQCEWLHKKITTSFRLQALPLFPEQPIAKKINDTLYVERHRARMERWLNRLGSREDLCQSESMDYFISTRMSEKDIGGSSKQSFSSMMLNLFGGPIEQEFRVYTPIGEIDDYDEDEEERRREYLRRTEECARELASSIKNMHVHEEILGKSIVKATLAIGKAFQAESLSFAPLEPSAQDVYIVSSGESPEIERERLQVSLALLQNSAEAHYWSTKELAIWKEFNFVDTMTEYCTMVGGVKEVMNHSTQMLVMYEKAMQSHQGYVAKANSLRVQYPSDTPSVKYANEQEVESGREKEMAHQEYTDACDMANKELIRYERERATDICKALENTAKLELDSARARCQELRALCRRIKSVQMVKDPPHSRTNIGPMLWHAAGSNHPSMLTPRISSSSFPRTAPVDNSLTFNDRMIMSRPAAERYTHRHSSSSSSSSSAVVASSSNTKAGGPCADNIPGFNIKRAHTMDNADFYSKGKGQSVPARNHRVFMETDEDNEDENYLIHRTLPVSGSSSKSIWSKAQESASPSPLQQKTRWNGRISAMPFQGYDPEADSEPRPVVDQDRLAEMATEAEMEAELVRSGMLTARQATRQKSIPNSSAFTNPGQQTVASPDTMAPSVLPAFRGSSGSNQLRQVSSLGGLSSIPQPVSPSEYLQYSRQTLHSSLSHGVRTVSSGSGRGSSGSPRSALLPRKDKGKGRAFAV
ncbi:hypothetical protein LPJ66_009827, partial [Kickxella alabastrina]